MRPLLRRLRSRRDRGSALVEFVTLGIVFIIPLIWLVLAVFDVQRAVYGVNAAAREAGRAFVLAPNETEAVARAEEAADVALGDQGIDLGPNDAHFDYECEPAGGCLNSGSDVTVTIDYAVDIFFLPDAFQDIRPTAPVKAVHRTPYGEYRQSR